MTTNRRGRATAPAALIALTLAAAACTTTALVLGSRHLLAACEGSPVPWSQFAWGWAALVTAVLAAAVCVVARVRGSRGSREAGSTAATGRAGLVTAVLACVVVLAAAFSVWSNYSQAAMAYENSRPNVLVACTSG